MNRLTLSVLLLVVALTRLPLVSHGYGADPDAWRVASSASRVWSTGEYEVSRYPGYPLHEIVSAPLVGLGGAVGSNIATLVVALLLLVTWNRIALREAHHPALLVITLACTPLFLKNSAVTMDYVWSLFFLLLAFDRALQGKSLTAGLAVGVAAGFRMANLVAVIPLGILFMHQTQLRRGTSVRTHPGKVPSGESQQNQTVFRSGESDQIQSPQARRRHHLVMFILGAIGTYLICYLPLLLTGGPDRWFAETSAQIQRIREHQELGLRMFAYRGIYAFGPLAAVGGAYFVARKWKVIARGLRTCDPLILSAVTAIIVFGALFFALPLEREYLLPLLPFALILFDRILSRSQFFLLSVLLVSYAFLNPDIIAHDGSPGKVQPHVREGVLLEDCRKRLAVEQTRSTICGLSLPPKTLVITGFPEPYWFGEKRVEKVSSQFHEQMFRNSDSPHTLHIFALSPEEAGIARSLGFTVHLFDVHTPDVRTKERQH